MLALLSFVTPGHSPARSSCGEPSPTDTQLLITVSSLMTSELDQVIPALERLQTCGTLDAIRTVVERKYSERHDVRTAILMVHMLANGAVNMNDTRVASAVKLMAFQIEKLAPDRQEVLLGYAARTLATNPDTEPLLAFVRGSIPQPVEAAIMAGVATKPVPRGRWEPPGKQPIPFYVGNEAHDKIAAHYINAHKGEVIRANTIPISAMLIYLAKLGVGPVANAEAQALGELALRPDIVNLTTREVYEIKPAGAEFAAEAAVAAYVTAFARAGVTMKPGRSWAPGTEGVVPAPAGHFIFYGHAPGVIVYRYQRGDYLPVPVTDESRAPNESPVPVPVENARHALARPSREPSGFWARMERVTGLTGAALGVYLIISEGSRVVFPPRNLVPVP